MQYEMSVDRTGVLVIEARGPASLRESLALIDVVAGIREAQGVRLALCDLRETIPNLDAEEHVAVGVYAASTLDKLVKVATVVPARFRTGVSEGAAKATGLRLRTFTDRDEAEEWLRDTARV